MRSQQLEEALCQLTHNIHAEPIYRVQAFLRREEINKKCFWWAAPALFSLIVRSTLCIRLNMYGALHLWTNVQSNMLDDNNQIDEVFHRETSDPKCLR